VLHSFSIVEECNYPNISCINSYKKWSVGTGIDQEMVVSLVSVCARRLRNPCGSSRYERQPARCFTYKQPEFCSRFLL